MMTGDQLRLGHDPSRHAAYVGSWIQALKDDPREVYRASQDAQVMSDYVLDRAREKGLEREAAREKPPSVRHLPEQPGFRRHFPREGPSR